MSQYRAPIQDIQFTLDHIASLTEVQVIPSYSEVTKDLISAILEQAALFGSDVLSPLNRSGDEKGAVFETYTVKTPDGFAKAYQQFAINGWNSLPFTPEFGGQDLPWVLHTAVQEIWHASNMALALCPMLTQSAIELLLEYASPTQKSLFLPRLISGKWTGTMNLTESQAGSDLSRIQTRAVPVKGEPGTYRLIGQKIFVTYGEHDMAENIIHLVLARVINSPTGLKGISLFIVPKILVTLDGQLASHNDISCVSLEHKFGIRASPTATINFGDDDGAIGYLVGKENHGLEYMFTMMNSARLSVGLEGIAIAERAYQQAQKFACERIQGRSLINKTGAVPIIHHPDVRRMLLTMKALTEAARGIAYYTAARVDISRRHPDKQVRLNANARVALLTPIVKAWSTDVSINVANLGIQVHGGIGFLEPTGVTQYLRDARITAIYEGTNGIQAHDLVSRRIIRDQGIVARLLIFEIRTTAQKVVDETVRSNLLASVNSLEAATNWIIVTKDLIIAQSAAVLYVHLFGLTLGGFTFARAIADRFHTTAALPKFKMTTARFYIEYLLPKTKGLLAAITAGSESVMSPPWEIS